MSTRTSHTTNFEVYFCIITRYKWLSLFEIAKSCDAVYNWFDHLKQKVSFILGYVIMLNHLHVLLFPTEGSINRPVSNGKRFMAYDIVNRLKMSGNEKVLQKFRAGIPGR